MINWSDLVPSIIFSSVILVAFVYFILKSSKQDITIETYTKVCNVLVSDMDCAGVLVDIHLSSEHIMNQYPIKIRSIASQFNKGYDFLHLKYQKHTAETSQHFHRKTNELIYVLEGSVVLEIVHVNNNFVDFFKKQKPKTRIKNLKAGEWYYVPSQCRHSFKILEDTEMIIIARPPLFTRIGRFYEKFFKTQ